MSPYSTTTFSAIAFMAFSSLAETGDIQQQQYNIVVENSCNSQTNGVLDSKNCSGIPITLYINVAKNFIRSTSEDMPMDAASEEALRRCNMIKNSFSKHKVGFPDEKMSYLDELANIVCHLQFKDNISEYNEYDETIDTVINLSNGLTLSISQFLCEKKDAPVVFSIHRERELLVTDAMPLKEVIDTINSVVQKG